MSTVHAADENQQIKCYGRHHRLLEVQGVAVDVAKKACNIIKEHADGSNVVRSKGNSRDLLTIIDPVCEKPSFPSH
jgi:hypothetical protein